MLKIKNLVIIIAIFGFFGCAKNTAPYGFLKTPKEQLQNPYGGWAEVRTKGGVKIDGELLALDVNKLFLLKNDNVGITIQKDSINSVVLTGYDTRKSPVSGMVFGGMLLTLSHGLGAIFSFPLYTGLGSAAAGSHSYSSRIKVETGKNWNQLNTYARFPQGKPDSLLIYFSED